MLDKLDTLERPEDIWATAEKVAFRFAPAPRSGDIVLEAQGLAAERGGRRLFSGIDLLVRRGERVGVVGPNGSGKSTLLKLLAGAGAPEDRGSVRRGTNLHQGYFDQHLGSLDPAKTAVEEIRGVRGDLNVDGARQYLARFRFWGDDPLRRVSGFSGGERSRLALAKLLLEPRNLLFLDEPTNHLDIPAAEILEEALAGFEGTAILVSHDRRFLEGVTTRVILVRGGEVEIYPGGFRDYEETLARRAAQKAAADRAAADEAPPKTRARASEPPGKARAVKRSASTKPQPTVTTEQDAETKRRAFEAEKAATRTLERKKKRVKELETEIASGEAELGRRREELKQDPGGNWAKLADLAKQEQALARRLDASMAEWMALSEELGGGAT
jgi:ATP-binding cassette subfamily F protein 3